MGIFLSADLFTTFIFFEIMSFTSFVLVMHDEEDFTVRSAKNLPCGSGDWRSATLMGLFMMYQKAGTLNMTELTAFLQSRENLREFYAIGVLILFGFAAKAGLFPAAYLAAECVYRCTGTLQCAAQLSADKNRRIRYDYRQLQAFPA